MKNIIKLLLIITILTSGPTMVSAGSGLIAEYLAKAQFTTRIFEREPVDNIKKLNSNFKKIYFFTDVRDCKGCRIEHQWWHKGNEVSSVDARAKYPRYRWWSSKTLTDNFWEIGQ